MGFSSSVRSGTEGSGKDVVECHAAPDGAWLIPWNLAIDMALLTELRPGARGISAADV